jgi:hypothetical protein
MIFRTGWCQNGWLFAILKLCFLGNSSSLCLQILAAGLCQRRFTFKERENAKHMVCVKGF